MSFAIKLNDVFLDNNPGKLSLKFKNNMFSEGVILSDYSLPVSLPISPKNSRLLSFSQLLNIDNVTKEFEKAALYIAGLRYSKAKLFLRSIKNQKADCNVNFGMGSIPLFTKNLREIIYDLYNIGATTNDIIADCNARAQLDYPATTFNFPVLQNPEFYDEANPQWETFVNQYEPGVGFIANVEVPVNNRTNLVPFFYLLYILKKGFATEGYAMQGSFVDDADCKQLMLYNNYALDKIRDNFNLKILNVIDQGPPGPGPTPPAFVYLGNPTTIKWQQATNDQYAAFSDPDDWVEVKAIGDYLFTGKLFFSNVTFGGFAIEWYLDGVLIGSQAGGNPNHDIYFAYTTVPGDIGKKLTMKVHINTVIGFIYNLSGNSYCNITVDTTGTYTLNFNEFTGDINPQNHLPDRSFGDLLSAVKTIFNLNLEVDHFYKTVSLNFQKNYFTAAPLSLAEKVSGKHEINVVKHNIMSFAYDIPTDDDLTENNFLPYDPAKYIGEFVSIPAIPDIVIPPGYFALILNEAKIYISYEITPGVIDWKPYTDDYFTQTLADDGQEITVAAGPLFMTTDKNLIIPHILQTGSSDPFAIGKNEFGLRLVFWRGLRASLGGSTYPLASSTPFDLTGNLTGARSLQWNTERGLIHQLWQEKINALADNITYTQKFNYNHADFFNFNISKKIAFGGCTFLILDADASIPANTHEKISEFKKQLLKLT